MPWSGDSAVRARRVAGDLKRLLTSTPLGLATLLVGLFVGIGAIVASTLSHNVTTLMTQQIVETLTAEAAGLQDLERAAGLPALQEAINRRAAVQAPGTSARHLYLLTDGDGRPLAGTLAADAETLFRSPAGVVFRYTTLGGPAGLATDQRWAVGVPVPLVSGARLLVARDVEELRAFAERLRWILIGAIGSLAAVGLGLGAITGRRVLSRIETVTRTADQIMAGDFTRRIPLTGAGDEVDNLSARLNLMLDRIEHLLLGMREISDNIAHDLKTPLSRLRNRAEAALRDRSGGAAHRDGLERTIEAADDIITTFNALLLIARLEAGAVRESFTTFDAADLVRDLADLYGPVAEEARSALAVDVPAQATLTANRQLIGQAVANLIDNAIKYGGRGETPQQISVSLRVEATEVVLTVADQGPGIAAADRDHVLRRFVRLDQSRTAPGTGLGLSLVAAVARLHGARLTLGDNQPGLRVEMAVPRGLPPGVPSEASRVLAKAGAAS